MLRTLFVIAAILVTPRVLHAAPKNDKSLQAGFTSFMASITDDAKTAKLQDTQLVILPAAGGIVTAPSGLTAKDLVATSGVTWKVRFVRATLAKSWSDDGAVAADVDAFDAKKKKVATLRVSALMARPDARSPWTVIAIHFGAPLADDKAAARAADGKEPKLATVPDGFAPAAAAAKIARTDTMSGDADDVKQLTKDNLARMLGGYDGLLLGSAPGEAVQNPDRVRSWQLELASDGNIAFGAPPNDDGMVWVAANVKVKHTYKNKPVEHSYRGFFVFQTVMGAGGASNELLMLAHFSSAL